MNLQRKLDLIDTQIAQAAGGEPSDFEGWRQQTDVILRQIMGESAPILKRFRAVQYSPMMWTERTDFRPYQVQGVQNAVKVLEATKLELNLAHEVEQVVAPTATNNAAAGNRVFIVHGHDEAIKFHLTEFLSRLTGTSPTILHRQPNKGRVLMEKFEQSASSTGYAIVLLTADDLGRTRDAAVEQPRARQNVVFEMGFFFGAFGRERVTVLYEEGVELPGDIAGLVYTPLDAGGGWKSKVATELSEAGLTVDWQALKGG